MLGIEPESFLQVGNRYGDMIYPLISHDNSWLRNLI